MDDPLLNNNPNEVGYKMAVSCSDRTNQLTGELTLNYLLETQKVSGEFIKNKYLVENLCSIIDTLRIHQSKKLTKDHFLGLTIQFSDHYYKIDLSKGDRFVVEKYNITRSDIDKIET